MHCLIYNILFTFYHNAPYWLYVILPAEGSLLKWSVISCVHVIVLPADLVFGIEQNIYCTNSTLQSSLYNMVMKLDAFLVS